LPCQRCLETSAFPPLLLQLLPQRLHLQNAYLQALASKHAWERVAQELRQDSRSSAAGCGQVSASAMILRTPARCRNKNKPGNKKATCMASVCKICHTWYSFSSLATCAAGEARVQCTDCPPPRRSPSATGDFHTRRCRERGCENDSKSFESAILSFSSPLVCTLHSARGLLSR